ncbi:MAG: toll/interleukin-1 receptor domain-containing protein, partial [Dissulfurispiraceae bacterium]
MNALSIKKLMKRARDYVEHEANTNVLEVSFEESFTLFGLEDVVLSVKTTDKRYPELWVVGGSSPINLYTKKRLKNADEAFSMHTGLMLRLHDKEFKKANKPPKDVGYDAFISHATEDKARVARPLAEKLKELGFLIWYDEFTLEIGDSLRRSIDKGLVNSRYGIVILSPAFFKKEWPQYELNGLTAREIEGKKVILPVWHNVTKNDVLKFSPALADKVAASTAQ